MFLLQNSLPTSANRLHNIFLYSVARDALLSIFVYGAQPIIPLPCYDSCCGFLKKNHRLVIRIISRTNRLKLYPPSLLTNLFTQCLCNITTGVNYNSWFIILDFLFVVVNVIYCDNNFMVIGREHVVFQLIPHIYTTYKIGYKIMQ